MSNEQISRCMADLAQMAGRRFVDHEVPLHEVLMEVLSRPVKSDSSVYIQGGIGTGKTHQLVEAGRYLINHSPMGFFDPMPAVYVSFPEMIRGMDRDKMKVYTSTPWLLLDEVGFPVDEASCADMMELFDTRYRNGLPIIFASLYKLSEILAGDRPGWDSRVSSRILEMCGVSKRPAPDNYISLKTQHRLPGLDAEDGR